MGQKTETVRLELKASDEASGAVERLGKALRTLNKEQRAAGENQIERLLKGGGVAGLAMFAIEAVGKSAEATREAIRGVQEGTLTTGQAVNEVVNKTLDSVPIIGSVRGALLGIADAIDDGTAALAVSMGVDEDWAEQNLESASSVIKKYEELGKAIDASQVAARKGQKEAAIAVLKGAPRQEREEDDRFEKEKEDIVGEEKKRLEGVNKYSSEYRKIVANYQSAIEGAGVAHEERKKQIQKDGDNAAEEQTRLHLQRLTQIDAASRATILQEAGLTSEAEIVLLNAKYAKEISDRKAAAKREADLTSDPKRKQEIAAQADKEGIAIELQRRQAIAAMEREDNRRREGEFAEHERKITGEFIEAAAERLRLKHRDAEADLLVLKNAHKEELAEIDRHMKEQAARLMQAGPLAVALGAPKIVADANRRKSAADASFSADVDKINQAHGERTQENDANAANAALQARVGILRDLARQGDTFAEMEAQRLETAAETDRVIDDINKKLREQKDLTEAGKKNLQDALAVQQQRKQDLDANQKQQRENALVEAKIELLRTLGEGGNKQAEQEAEEMEIRMKAEQKLGAMRKQLEAESDVANKKAIQQQIDLVKQTEDAALANLIKRRHAGDGAFQAAPGEHQGAGMLGLKAAAEVQFHNEAYFQEQMDLKAHGLAFDPKAKEVANWNLSDIHHGAPEFLNSHSLLKEARESIASGHTHDMVQMFRQKVGDFAPKPAGVGAGQSAKGGAGPAAVAGTSENMAMKIAGDQLGLLKQIASGILELVRNTEIARYQAMADRARPVPDRFKF